MLAAQLRGPACPQRLDGAWQEREMEAGQMGMTWHQKLGISEGWAPGAQELWGCLPPTLPCLQCHREGELSPGGMPGWQRSLARDSCCRKSVLRSATRLGLRRGWGAGVKQGGTVRGIGLLGPHLGQGQAGWLGKGPMGISLTVARGWEGI